MDSSPAVAEDQIFVGSEDNKLYALNATTGASIWNYETEDMVVTSPSIVNGIAYIGSYDHLVYAIGEYIPNPNTYEVSFIMSGLSKNENWEVTFNSQTKNSYTDTITFEIQSGEYSFSVVSPSGYEASPSSGILIVSSKNITEQIMFTSNVQDASFLIILLISLVVIILVALAALILYKRK